MNYTKYKYILVQSCDVFFCQDDLKKWLHSPSLRNYFLRSIGEKGLADRTKIYFYLVLNRFFVI